MWIGFGAADFHRGTRSLVRVARKPLAGGQAGARSIADRHAVCQSARTRRLVAGAKFQQDAKLRPTVAGGASLWLSLPRHCVIPPKPRLTRARRHYRAPAQQAGRGRRDARRSGSCRSCSRPSKRRLRTSCGTMPRLRRRAVGDPPGLRVCRRRRPDGGRGLSGGLADRGAAAVSDRRNISRTFEQSATGDGRDVSGAFARQPEEGDDRHAIARTAAGRAEPSPMPMPAATCCARSTC